MTVFAAASLTAAFTEIGEAFKVENPDAEVVLNFAGSSDLVTQITEGAPADVFASADLEQHDQGDRCRPERRPSRWCSRRTSPRSSSVPATRRV